MTSIATEQKIVGIIGGMGPEATVDLMRRVIQATPAKDDIDHIRMLVDNNPKIPSRIRALVEGTGESPAPHMIATAHALQQQGADFLAIPCNTAHYYYPQVTEAVDIPVLHMIQLTANHCQQAQSNLQKVGLLASTALQKIHLYEPYFQSNAIEVLYPQEAYQQLVMQLIRSVKANSSTKEQLADYHRAAENLQEQGAQCLVISCTELSVINDALKTALPVYDASDILAQAIVDKALTQ